MENLSWHIYYEVGYTELAIKEKQLFSRNIRFIKYLFWKSSCLEEVPAYEKVHDQNNYLLSYSEVLPLKYRLVTVSDDLKKRQQNWRAANVNIRKTYSTVLVLPWNK